jgi:hypothetical protein
VLNITALDSKNETYPNIIWDKGLRALVISFTMFDFENNFHFYFILLYEFSPTGVFFPPHIDITHFKSNLYLGKEGQTIRTYNTIRLVFSIILMFVNIHTLYSERKSALKHDPFASYVHSFLSLKFLCEFLIYIVFWIIYALEDKYLNDNRAFNLIPNKTEYLNYPYTEYNIAAWVFTLGNFLETFIFFFGIWRIISIGYPFLRIKGFAYYVHSSLVKFIYMGTVLLFVYFGFSVAAHNILGQSINNFEDFSSSLVSILLLSLGKILNNNNIITYYRPCS